MNNGKLEFKLHPVLPVDYFDENNEVCCKIFNSTNITYINNNKKDTFGGNKATVKRYILHYPNGRKVKLNDVTGDHAEDIRNGVVSLIEAILE